MTEPRSSHNLLPPQPRQYTAGYLAAAFGLTPTEAGDILDKADGDRNAAAEMARLLREQTSRR